MNFDIVPWLSPKLSQSMAGVLYGLGHSVTFRRGDEVYSSPGFFEKLMFVRSGFVVKALQDPVRDEPLLISMAGPGALCGSYENLYVRDRMPRKHWCLTTTHVLVVNQELLLKIADQNPVWQRELSSYSSSSVLCDRMAMYANHAGTVDERFGALIVLMLQASNPSVIRTLESKGVEWVELPFLPSKGICAKLIGSSFEQADNVSRSWVADDDIRRRSGRLWLRRSTFARYWAWVKPFLQQQSL